jgi:hypothetical protein
MTSGFQGGRPHGIAEDMGQDMDLAWQELMTITDLQVKYALLPFDAWMTS